MKGPFTVEPTSRRVIEHKLLTALEDGNTVAILASKQDLADIIAALSGYVIGDWRLEHDKQVLSWQAHLDRCKALADGLRQLQREAFPPSEPQCTCPMVACPVHRTL